MARYEGRMRLISETNINIANNTSYVTVAFDVRCVDSNWWPWNQNGNAYWKITVDGQTSGNVYFSFKWSLQAGQWKEVARKSFTITHTANGSKTINMSGYVFLDVTPSSISGSGSATLQTIPRASSIGNISGNTIGSQMTININSHSNSFTHRFWYKMGGSNWIEVTVPAGSSSITFTPTMNLCSQIPNSTSGTLQLSLRTMQGSAQIGADQNKNVTAYVPSSIVPSINNLSISEAVSGISQQFNSFVQGNSKLRVTTSSGGSYGSTIKNVAIECDGRKYNGADITTEVINASGQVAIKTIVTDSRGRTTTLTKNVTVIEYHGIQILGFAAKRCAPDGTEKDDGISLSLGINFKIAPVGNKNTKNYVVEIQKDGNANSWTQVANGSVYVLNGNIVAKNVVDQDFTYKVRLKVSDYFSSVQVENQIGTSFSLMDFNASGKGIAFGKASEKDAFEVDLNSEFNKPVQFKSTINGHNFRDLAKIENTNEMNFVPPNYNNDIHVNYTTSDGSSSGQINAYKFRNGSKGFSDIWAKEFCDQNGKGVFATLNNLVNQIGGAVFQGQANLPNNQRPTGFSGYCRFIKIGNAVPGKGGGGDTYYIMIDSGKNLYTGVQLNGGANISWRKI